MYKLKLAPNDLVAAFAVQNPLVTQKCTLRLQYIVDASISFQLVLLCPTAPLSISLSTH